MSKKQPVGEDLIRKGNSFNYFDDHVIIQGKGAYKPIKYKKFVDNKVQRQNTPNILDDPGNSYTFSKPAKETTYNKQAKAWFNEQSRRKYNEDRLAKINVDSVQDADVKNKILSAPPQSAVGSMVTAPSNFFNTPAGSPGPSSPGTPLDPNDPIFDLRSLSKTMLDPTRSVSPFETPPSSPTQSSSPPAPRHTVMSRPRRSSAERRRGQQEASFIRSGIDMANTEASSSRTTTSPLDPTGKGKSKLF